LNSYFGGHGKKVYASMIRQYGSSGKAKRVFYGTANKTGQVPKKRVRRRRKG
jgi:hypothetical protein